LIDGKGKAILDISSFLGRQYGKIGWWGGVRLLLLIEGMFTVGQPDLGGVGFLPNSKFPSSVPLGKGPKNIGFT